MPSPRPARFRRRRPRWRGTEMRAMISATRRAVYPALRSTVLAAAVLVAGCSFMPTYERPSPPVPADFPEVGGAPSAARIAAQPAAEIDWRQFYADERLRRLVELALANNRDLRVAVLNIEQARALYQIQRAELFPAINATGAAIISGYPRPPARRAAPTPATRTRPTSASPPTSSICSAASAASTSRRSSSTSPRPRRGAARRSA